MWNGLDKATHVLCVCSETYYRRFRGKELPGKGKGVDWEGALISQSLYDSRHVSTKFFPVIFSHVEQGHIPEPLRGQTFYLLDSEHNYQDLYDALLNQSGIVPGPIGVLKRKKRSVAKPLEFDKEKSSEPREAPAARPIAKQKKNPAQPTTVRITGDNNLVGNNNVVSINSRVVDKTVVQTGVGVIDAAQRAELKALIHQWIESRNAVRKKDLTFGGAWAALNNHFRVNSYHEIPMASFGTARAWLKSQMAIVGAMPSAKKKLPDWRTTKIRAIKAACKNQLGDEHAYLAYIERNFALQSLTKLDDDQLQKTYQYVMGRKSR